MELIKELPEIFTKKGKKYIQIGKNDSAYLYEVNDIEPDKNSHTYFEVFFRRIEKARTYPNGNRVPKRVIYPWDEAFGDWAYCIHRGNDVSTARRIATYRFNYMDEYAKEQKQNRQSA
ncbi:hypothetical protein [Zobellia sp. 1_MG-2023]|uniref:hypothetical protein n=1 Tax=Zobellia sp. 1_MG-2023 TaxID=3062626 RepID=UPI0026E2FE22|nr:hypothetical protein [Zobellia sp. 1_MG-2023]MDO6819078.1 hypothetical protein [Zobellia sp. 1_MG-2023]